MSHLRSVSRILPHCAVFPTLIVIVFVIQLGLSLSDLPTTKLAQDIICLLHNTKDDSNDTAHLELGYLPEGGRCHGEIVQSRLNAISIGLSVSQAVGMALAALPFGSLADRIGRIPVLLIATLGLLGMQAYILAVLWSWSTVPVKALWAAGSFLLIGGGRGVAEAVVFTMVSDISPEHKRASRFQWIACSVLLGQLIAQPIASALMNINPWLPLYLSLAFISTGALATILLMPETKGWGAGQDPTTTTNHRQPYISHRIHQHQTDTEQQQQQQQQQASITPADSIPERQRSRSPLVTPMRIRRLSLASTETETKSLWTTLLSLRHHRQLLLLLPGAALSIPLASAQVDILFRLMPVAYGWTLSASSLLVSLRSGATIVVIGAVLPLIKSCLSRKRKTAETRSAAGSALAHDRWIAQVSAVLLFLGSLLTMMVWRVESVLAGVVVSSLGAGVPMLCRSLVVAVACGRGMDECIGGLFGALAILETVAYIVFVLGFGALFDVGLGEGSWMGWPFVAAMVVSTVVAACLLFFKTPPDETADEDLDRVLRPGGSKDDDEGGLKMRSRMLRSRGNLYHC